MSRYRTALIAALLLTIALAPAAQAYWVQQANSVFQAERDIQKHPKKLEQTMVLASRAEGGQVCVAYRSDHTEDANRGRIVTRLEVARVNGQFENFRLVTNLRDRSGVNCKDLPNFQPGAVFAFRHNFKKMARLRTIDGAAQSAVLSAFVTTVGTPDTSAGPLALIPEGGNQPFGLEQGNGGGWFHSTNSIFHPNESMTHPKSLTSLIVVPADTGLRPLICSGYSRGPEGTAGGRVITKAKIVRADGSVERKRLAGNVLQDGSFLRCKRAQGKIDKGDVVAFSTRYKRMPAVEPGAFVDLIKAVSTTGQPEFGPGPPEPEPEPEVIIEESDPGDDNGNGGDGGGGSPPPPPGGGGGGGGGGGAAPPPPPPPSGGGCGAVTASEELAATYVLDGRTRHLGIEQNHQPVCYNVFGPKTKLLASGQIDTRTAGYGNTVAAALFDYERKQGSMGGQGRRMTGSERAALQWYLNMRPNGNTAIRKNRTGQFFGDVWRPSLGVVIGGPFSTLEGVVNWMKSIGL